MSQVQYVHTTAIHNTSAAAEVLPYVFSLPDQPPRTVLDVGCGTGSWLRVARDLGATHVQGLDGIHVDQSLLVIAPEEFQQHDLTEPFALGRTYDLVICLEVAEHLPDGAAVGLVKRLTEHGAFILFSAAIPNQGGQFHINEQWPAYWQPLFEQQGFYPYDILRKRFWENERVEWWYRQNMLIYAPREAAQWLDTVPAVQVQALVHPELFALQTSVLHATQAAHQVQVRQYEAAVYTPAVLPSLKRLIKACLLKTPLSRTIG